MAKLPENWRKGSLPKEWGKNTISSHIEEKIQENTDNTSKIIGESENDFLTGNEMKAKLNSTISNINKEFNEHADIVKKGAKFIGKKAMDSAKRETEKLKSGLKNIKDIDTTDSTAFDEKYAESSTEVQNIESKLSSNCSEKISQDKDGTYKNQNDKKSKKRPILLILFVSIGIIAVSIGIFVFFYFYSNTPNNVTSEVDEVSETPSTPSIEESSALQEFTPYQLQITTPGILIYEGSGYDFSVIDSIQESGFYTIVDEVQQSIGDKVMIWGNLESDRGWINLNELHESKTENNAMYILPYSSERLLTNDDIRNLSSGQLMLARNEIYARHGRIFQDNEIRTYFESQPWYHGKIAPEDFSADVLSEIEQKNIEFIRAYELSLENESTTFSTTQDNSLTNTHQTSLTESEAKEILRELLPAAQRLQGLLFGSSLSYSESNYLFKGQTKYCAVTNPNYQSIQDIKETVETIYTKQCATERFYNSVFDTFYPRYIEQDGKLYVSPGGIGGGYTWNMDSLTILKTEDPNVVFIQMEREGYGETTNETIELCKENGKWLFNTVIY